MSKREWPDLEEAMRNIERGVFDDSSFDTMPLGDKEARVPVARTPKRLRSRSTTAPSTADHRPARAAGY